MGLMDSFPGDQELEQDSPVLHLGRWHEFPESLRRLYGGSDITMVYDVEPKVPVVAMSNVWHRTLDDAAIDLISDDLGKCLVRYEHPQNNGKLKMERAGEWIFFSELKRLNADLKIAGPTVAPPASTALRVGMTAALISAAAIALCTMQSCGDGGTAANAKQEPVPVKK